MESLALETPKTGRSRFSKALPVPPPGLDERPKTATKQLPGLPASPFPPRKDSVSTRTVGSSGISIKAKPLDSPLPALPPTKMEFPQVPGPSRSIVRKPLAPPASTKPMQPQPTQQADMSSAPKDKKMKRVSSISSLLSAYSFTSTESAQRSSQDSDATKDSEPSYSPEREAIHESRLGGAKDFTVLSMGNPYADEMAQMNKAIPDEPLPPPPPMKDPARPSTPRERSPSKDEAVLSSPLPGAGSPPRKEIWRRRASSKSDRSIAVTGLKLAVSHGSTAASSSHAASAEPLPPRNASLPGRNIRPAPAAQQDQTDDEMRFLPKLPLKSAKRGESPAIAANHNDEKSAKHKAEMKKMDETTKSPGAKPFASSSLSSPEHPPHESAATGVISRRPVGAPANKLATTTSDLQKKPSTPELSIVPSDRGRGQHPSVSLPRTPRPTRSSPGLRSSHSQNVPEPDAKVMAQPSQPAAAPAVRVHRPQEDMSGQTGAKSNHQNLHPHQQEEKPELLDLVTELNHPSPTFKDSSATREQRKKNEAPPRMVSKTTHSVPLSDVNETAENNYPESPSVDLDAPLSAELEAALLRFPRKQNMLEMTPATDGSWPTAPLSDKHFSCYTKHSQFVNARNAFYVIACQTCGVGPDDKMQRKVCGWCNLRVCHKCHEAIAANGRDLKKALAVIKGKGKE
ncbi:hypothetical protein F5Y15DRAFT_141367 [Xylariaceae sp. FL0016]|nr:hypothetical protein F5Y15DRAFT_141367 [Xylariaceae sp. FL0016]